MNILLKRIVEQQGSEQLYDLGRDFANFKRTMDGTSEQVKQKFEQAIGTKLNGKRVRARASRGYKQYVKDYEFDVSKVSLDDYYDNYVVVAYDNSTPKPKEYFLKPGFKIQVIGVATGQPSPQKGNKPGDKQPQSAPAPVQPKEDPNAAQHQQMAQAPAGGTPGELAVKENDGTDHYDAYSIDSIIQDIKPWMPDLLLKPETALRDFVKGLGWMKNLGHGKSVAMYDLKIPVNALKIRLDKNILTAILAKMSRAGSISTRFDIANMTPNENNDEWQVRLKKTMTDTSA